MILLAASLPGLRFQPGLPIPGAENVSPANTAVQSGPSDTTSLSPWLLQGGLAIGIVLFAIAFVIALGKKASLKWIGMLAAGLALLFALFNLLPRLAPAPVTPLIGEPAAALPPVFVYAVAPIGAPPSNLFTWVIAGLLLAAAVLLVWLLIRAFPRKQKADPLGEEAQAAVQAIAEGQSLKNIIIRSYLKMERLVAEERGLEREEAVTPREFEAYLVERGIPRMPILQLTRLFEKARYSNQSMDHQDEQEAVSCLLAIRTACQRGAQ